MIVFARDTSNYGHGDVMYALAYIRVYPAREGNALDRTRGWQTSAPTPSVEGISKVGALRSRN